MQKKLEMPAFIHFDIKGNSMFKDSMEARMWEDEQKGQYSQKLFKHLIRLAHTQTQIVFFKRFPSWNVALPNRI